MTIYQFKAKDSEIMIIHYVYELFQNILQLIRWESRFKRNCESFNVDYNRIDTSDILDIHKYLMIET